MFLSIVTLNLILTLNILTLNVMLILFVVITVKISQKRDFANLAKLEYILVLSLINLEIIIHLHQYLLSVANGYNCQGGNKNFRYLFNRYDDRLYSTYILDLEHTNVQSIFKVSVRFILKTSTYF